jgi:hypothetical protein
MTVTFTDYDPSAHAWRDFTLSTTSPSISIETGGPTDEGFHSSSTEWELVEDEGRVLKTSETDSRDCDGPHQSYRLEACPLTDLHARASNDRLLPAWKTVNAHQRDHFAEAAGY